MNQYTVFHVAKARVGIQRDMLPQKNSVLCRSVCVFVGFVLAEL